MNYQLKNLLKLSPPLISNYLLGLVLPLTATFFIAKLGTIQLAALAIGSVTNFIFNNFVNSGVIAVGILASNVYREKQSNKIREIFIVMFPFAILFSLLPAILLWNLPVLLAALKWHHQLLPYLNNYFHSCSIALMITTIYMVLIQFMQGTNRAKLSVIFNLLKIGLAIPLSYYLIFGKNHLGISAIPITQIFIQSIFILILIGFMLKTLAITQINFRNNLVVPILSKMFKVGLPLGIQAILERGIMLVATYMIGYFGISALAAAQLATQCVLVIAAIQSGVTDATTLLVSRLNQTGRNKLTSSYIRYSIFITISIAGISLLFASLIHEQYLQILASKYNHTATMAYLTRQFLIIGLIGLIMQGARNSVGAIFNGLHKTKITMLICTICSWSIAAPMAYFMGFIEPGGVIWLRWGLTLGYPVALGILAYLYTRLEKI